MKKLVMIASAALLMAGCSAKAPPSFGEQMATQAKEKQALAKQWQDANSKREKGLALVSRGQKNLAKAQEAMNKANLDIQNGQQMIAEGEAAMRASEDAVRALMQTPVEVPTTPLTVPPPASAQ